MNILSVRDLRTYFYTSAGVVKAVDGVSFDIEKGKVFGIVGESGSGKTLTALSVLNLISPPGKIVNGQILFDGADLLKMDGDHLRGIRGAGISMVFQEPGTSLNPVFTIGSQLMESVLAHRQSADRRMARDVSLEYLERVHIKEPERIFCDYPHQLSGGTKQRVMIAMALLNSPELLILDEPTTALDVTIQAQILDLLDEIKAKERLSMLFISHDFGVIARICDEVAVMHKGRVVEKGSAGQILNAPREPYTIELLESVKALA